MAFDPKRHVIRVQGGREYLPVSARLVWFRGDHPDWGIVTEPLEINQEKQYALFRASIFNEEGRLIATATKREDVRGFPDYIEKSETGAVGRALALCGYGTQFAPELEEAGRFGDGARGGMRPANTMSRAPMAPPRPMERQTPPMERPERPVPPAERAERSALRDEPPPPIEDEAPFASRPAPSAPRPASREDEASLPPMRPASSLPRPPARPAPRGEGSSPRPAPPGTPIQRVREPERETLDPGGPDEDFEDPFADLEEAPAAPPANRPAPARNAVRRPVRAEAPESLL